jgi:MoaA/NifB/PqqE/SkfB family radical SAM enzyme
MSQQRLVYFKLFDNCNAKCNMCECWQLPRAKLGLPHYRPMLDRVLAARPALVRFTGGEPLLFRDLPSLITQASEAGARVAVISNGRLLASRLPVLRGAGCDEIVMSIDGMGDTHDRVRDTPGLFNRCLLAMAALADAAMPYGVNTVLQRQTIGEVAELATLLFAQPHRPAWWHLIPVRDSAELRPFPEQVGRFVDELPAIRRLAEAAGVQLVAEPHMFAPHPTPPCAVPSFTSYVDGETGNVYACNMLAYADRPIGNLREHNLRELYERSAAVATVGACGAGKHSLCGRCDASSAKMNGVLQIRAAGALVS